MEFVLAADSRWWQLLASSPIYARGYCPFATKLAVASHVLKLDGCLVLAGVFLLCIGCELLVLISCDFQ